MPTLLHPSTRVAPLFALPFLLPSFLAFALIVDSAVAQERPNIIMILADDLGNSDISAYNPSATPFVNTPAIDQLATQGIRFTDGRTPDGVCTPTRYGLLTGRYSWRSRLKTRVLTNGYQRTLMEENRATVATMLQGKGYNTHVVGKWHLGNDWSDASGNLTTSSSETASNRVDFTRPLLVGPGDHGFDTSILYPGSLNMGPYVFIRNHQASMADGTPITDQSAQMEYTSAHREAYGNNMHVSWSVNDMDISDVQPLIARESADYIAAQATNGDDSPFFLYVPFTGPHKPVAPSGDFPGANSGANTSNSPYGEFMADIDESVRMIVAAVDAQGQDFADNAIIIFSADNGAHQISFGSGGQHVANAPYRDKKLSAYDGGVRVPFIVRWGNKVAPGQVIDERVGLIDLFGTVADIVDHEIQEDEAEDTASFADILLNGDTTPIREGHMYHSYNGSFAIGSDEWKLFTDALGGASGADPDLSSWQLYNLNDDIDESDDLVNFHPNKAVEMGLMIARYEPNVETGRSRTHREMLARFDMIDFQAGVEGSPGNSNINELTLTNRLAGGITVAQGLTKGSGLAYITDDGGGGGGPETLLDDPFDDGDPATGGTNGGFQLQQNTTDVNLSLSESGGILTSSMEETSFANPNGGPVSINSFGSENGMTIVFEVDSVSERPTNNGMFIGVVDGNSNFYRNVDNVGFSFFGTESKQQSSGGFSFLVNDKNGEYNILDTGTNLNWADLADGFTAAMTFDANGWSYVLTGAAGSEISNSGAWTGGASYASVFDGEDFAVASYQNGTTGVHTVNLARVTVTTPEASGGGPNSGDEFHVQGMEETSLANAKANGDYLSFTLEVAEGQTAEDLLISFDLWRHGSDSATNYAIMTSADGFTAPIGELAFTESEFGINLGPNYTTGVYGVGHAKTISGLLATPQWFDGGQLEVRLYGYSEGQTLAGSTHVVGARVEGVVDDYATGATVEVTINQGDVQRSMMLDLDVSFSGDVQIGNGAFSMLKRGDGAVDLSSTSEFSGGRTTATLSFDGQYTEPSGSLVDGNYQLTINGDEVIDSMGSAVDVDGDGNPGGVLVIGDEEIEQLYRFFGDMDQNRIVNILDLLGFRRTYRLVTGDATFDASFDSNLDGIINIIDLLRFRQNYRQSLPFDDGSSARSLSGFKAPQADLPSGKESTLRKK